MADIWIPSSAHQPLPEFTVIGGHDSDHSTIYVGRAEHNGEMLAAKVIPSKGCAYVAWGGKEHAKHNYELLRGPGYSWVQCEYGQVPANAVVTGHSDDGEPLYIGRGPHCGSLSIGKVHSSHGCLYIPYGGQEISLDHYEILVRDPRDIWVPSGLHSTPANAVVAGRDTDGSVIYVARALSNGVMVPAKFIPGRCEAYVASDGNEVRTPTVEVLVGINYAWVPVCNGNIPPNAVYCGHTSTNEPNYIGRAHYNGSITPGLVLPDNDSVLITYGGQEACIGPYEILTRF
ncbi:uncharacterized protein LOC133337374 [Musca vetustissima]|uniref:uncharacterized protein LOC133337374 n=1 Tax=Musca vetustissima TaxID=27455 RepID=UPI002AB6A8B2|nr:uncharacterized protein LOC133337374 [Musca vetustissima]